ncbi:hypothetical protein JOQ06_027761 [Pogonophryne albipinna]|uniref:Uncharacterized protein n=1 Tax=Pogonophryne albipinna TaxID=1090488 RepID=A0AAD6A5U4_9TELE|nr:hypothetical protein JOQ06_027761 [Pogonophryne albipinna]
MKTLPRTMRGILRPLAALFYIGKDAKAKSLVIKKVTEEDAGQYNCRQIRSGQQEGPDSPVYLSVVTSWWRCIIVVIVEVAALTIITVAVIRRKRTQGTDTQTDVNVADPEDGVSYASISYTRKSSSKARIGKEAKAKSDRLRVTEKCSLGIKKVTEEDVGRFYCQQFNESVGKQSSDSQVYLAVVTGWWWIIVVIVDVAALTIITVAVIRRKRTQGTRTETDDDMADPEDGVSYASISYTRKSSRKARAHLHGDDEDDAVTYSTVRAPSSSSAASAVPSLLYATVNRENNSIQ